MKKEWNEEWERESNVGQLGGCPIGKEPYMPVGTLYMCVD